MAGTEVEEILREIRERVITQQRAAPNVTRAAPVGANGDSRIAESGIVGTNNPESTSKNLALINSYLTTTERAWDRLPPVVSNRSGFVASVELWCKRQIKRATRWYAWEQVNFNAAVHQALRDLLPVLAAYENELEKLRAETNAIREVQQERQRELAELRAELAARYAETQAALRLSSTQNAQVATQLSALIRELRERDELLREEQRVCFKQVSLETSEAATLEDRSRRKTETLLAELQRRLNEIEKKL